MIHEEFPSLYKMLYARVSATPDGLFLRRKIDGRWVDMSWAEGYALIQKVGRALGTLGFEPGTKVNLLANTSMPWIVSDLAIMAAGGVTVPIYQSNTPAECQYIIDNCEARFVFAENAYQLDKLRKVKGELSRIEKVILFDGPGDGDWVLSWDEFLALADKTPLAKLGEWGEAVQPEHEATYVYTSGTTGPPKGAVLTNDAIVYMTRCVAEALPMREPDLNLLFLPLAHIFARIIELGAVRSGYGSAIAEGIDKILDNLAETKPTFMGSVPRIYEKVYSRITGQARDAGGAKEKIFNWALETGREVSKRRQHRQAIPPALAIKFKIADKLVFSKLKAAFGGRIKFFISGGAPLSREIAEFFHAADMLILEGYGMTETTAVTNVNRPDHFKFGSVGPTVPGVEQKIAADGEILVRGRSMMTGYYKRPEATAETLEPDGWLHTGDIGEFDEDGFLRITDRKKDIIVTAGGKNIAPQNIENMMKTTEPVSQIVVIGDKRKYLVALVTLDADPAAKKGLAEGVLSADEAKDLQEAATVIANPGLPQEQRLAAMGTRDRLLEKLAAAPAIIKWVEAAIADKNKQLASYETIKKIRVVPKDFSIEGGELTPTLKVKRKVVSEMYKAEIESLYSEKFD